MAAVGGTSSLLPYDRSICQSAVIFVSIFFLSIPLPIMFLYCGIDKSDGIVNVTSM